MTIRKATPADAEAVAAIYSDIHTEEESGRAVIGWARSIYPTLQTALSAIERDDLFVMEMDGQIVGAAVINQQQVDVYENARWQASASPEQVMVLHTLVISPAVAQKGLGTRFVEFYEQYALGHGCPYLRMDTNARNLRARALYQKLGYREADIVPCVFNGLQDVQLVLLEKKLNEGVSMSVQLPDYQNCIANLACSIAAHFGIQPPNPTLIQADNLLSKGFQNVVLLVLDGMGINILEKHLASDGFFRRNLHCQYLSVFPPTTVAATTAAMSGLYPNQSAWLGWTGYFPQVDRNIVYYLNRDNDTKEEMKDFNVANTFVPFEKLADKIRASGTQAYELAAWTAPFPKTYESFCSELTRLCGIDGRKYIYAYWEQPDKAMHAKGIDDEKITSILKEMEQQTELLASGLRDTLLLITADHGMVNARCAVLRDYPDVAECLLRPPSMESRALNLFIRKGMNRQFEQAFLQHFGQSFMLLSKQQVLSTSLLGTGCNHSQLEGMLGDYLAIATGGMTIREIDKHHIGEHAGITTDEMTIPLIAVEK